MNGHTESSLGTNIQISTTNSSIKQSIPISSMQSNDENKVSTQILQLIFVKIDYLYYSSNYSRLYLHCAI